MTLADVSKPSPTQVHAHGLLRQMLLIRRFEAKSAEMYQASRIRGFLHLYDGEEAVAVGVMATLGPQDAVVATYREHGQALARGVPAAAIMAEMYGRVEGTCRGRGGSMHIFDARTRFFGGNAIVGGGLPLAVGLALADRMQQRPQVTACFFGDGAVAEGVFHESLNLAALWRVPVLFVCENNLYAMGTAIGVAQAATCLTAKAAALGLAVESVDGMVVEEVERAAAHAVEHLRAGQGPFFLECRTYRFRAHSMFDPEQYRDKAEVQAWRRRCPIETFKQRLREQGLLTDDALSAMEQSVEAEVAEAVAFAERGTLEPVADLTRWVYSS